MDNQPMGWICPVCGAVVSPNEKTCPKCSKNKIKFPECSTSCSDHNLKPEQLIYD